MTMSADDYIARVLDVLPRGLPTRTHIAMELRGHIAERTGNGHPIDEVLRQLGDPVKLAESYLSAEPLTSAPVGLRALAKLVDAMTIIVALTPLATLVYIVGPRDFAFPLLALIYLVGGSFAFGIYTTLAEHLTGQTLGKWLAGLRVVRETGARISLGQSIVRQLPMFLQAFWIDVMFAFFTDRRQRAFELLSKTRVVIASPNPTKPI